MVSIHEWQTQADTREVAGDVAVAEDSQAARKELGAFAVLVAQDRIVAWATLRLAQRACRRSTRPDASVAEIAM